MDEGTARAALVTTCRRTVELGINQGRSGNCSCRWNDGMWITPSAMAYDRMTGDDTVFVDAGGAPHGRRRPSSEWYFHHAIYAARPDVHAVVHVHSPAAVALSTHRMGIPPFHYMVALAGGPIRCSGYAPFGSEALAALAVEALRDRTACLLGNHGAIAVGADLEAALELAVEVEALADQYLRARTLGEPVWLTDDEMFDALSRFAAYRRP